MSALFRLAVVLERAGHLKKANAARQIYDAWLSGTAGGPNARAELAELGPLLGGEGEHAEAALVLRRFLSSSVDEA